MNLFAECFVVEIDSHRDEQILLIASMEQILLIASMEQILRPNCSV